MLHRVFAALALIAMPATAATYNVDLTGMVADTTVNTFTFGGYDFQSGTLQLSAITPFTVAAGDVIEFSVALDGSFVVPQSFATPGYGQLFGVNFNGMGDPAEPVMTSGAVTFAGLTGDYPNPAPGSCGNCIGLITGRPFGAAFSFTGLSGSATIDTLAAPYEITGISISYQINPTVAAVPEPATWALMIGGFFMAGSTVRARRLVGRVAN